MQFLITGRPRSSCQAAARARSSQRRGRRAPWPAACTGWASPWASARVQTAIGPSAPTWPWCTSPCLRSCSAARWLTHAVGGRPTFSSPTSAAAPSSARRRFLRATRLKPRGSASWPAGHVAATIARQLWPPPPAWLEMADHHSSALGSTPHRTVLRALRQVPSAAARRKMVPNTSLIAKEKSSGSILGRSSRPCDTHPLFGAPHQLCTCLRKYVPRVNDNALACKLPSSS
mmetsp:Transcript_14548/g.41286  ORF Transcript_14548/g.41286 Transcript_14548/m.41286 type:complete len:231 (-) Transcript_14548:230-922(-)